MSKIYMLGDGTHASPLKRLQCRDEDRELQSLLEKNHHLLPSDQIDPENPPQWLLIKREMPVTDPATGIERWSIDFLFVDHMAIPTLVECKRCNDTRSRREVIAQMLEYAANGHHYWTAADLQAKAQEVAGGAEQLDAWITRNRGGAGDAAEFFNAVIANLRKATMRLIFFLEESPNELRSLVDFLNGQLKETEVLLVEARLYESANGRIVVPWLFGYTEEARVAKRESRAQAAGRVSERGEAAFAAAIDDAGLGSEVRSAIRILLEAWPTIGINATRWSYGVNAILVFPTVLPKRGLFQVGRNGDIQFYFGYWNPDSYADIGPEQIRLKHEFADGLRGLFGVQFTDKQLRGFPSIKAAQWSGKVEEFVALIKKIVP